MNKLRIVSNKSQCHPTIVTVVRSIFSVACQQLVNRLGTLSKKRFPIDRDIVNGKKESSSIPSTRQNFDEKKSFFKKMWRRRLLRQTFPPPSRIRRRRLFLNAAQSSSFKNAQCLFCLFNSWLLSSKIGKHFQDVDESLDRSLTR